MEQDWLGVPMYFSGHDAETGRRLVQEAGLRLLRATLETAEEMGAPATFLWVVAQKADEGTSLVAGSARS